MSDRATIFPAERDAQGGFDRQPDAFRSWITTDGSSPYPAVPGRYHLYVSLACPWAHRIVLLRRLKRLEDIVGMTAVDPVRNEEDGWAFTDGPGHSRDPVNGFHLLKEAYLATDPEFHGRVTVPVLWDKETHRIVSNSDDDLLRMFNSAFDGCGGDKTVDFYPAPLREQIDRLNAILYDTVNDGVYKSGFADRQEEYERHVYPLFDTLDALETRLGRTRYLHGTAITESDWRLFVTLVRFDAVYVGHFKCNLRQIVDYPNLSGYLRDLYQVPGVADTVNFDHIKRHYYITHPDINPTRIVPAGPVQDLTRPHGRELLG